MAKGGMGVKGRFKVSPVTGDQSLREGGHARHLAVPSAVQSYNLPELDVLEKEQQSKTSTNRFVISIKMIINYFTKAFLRGYRLRALKTLPSPIHPSIHPSHPSVHSLHHPHPTLAPSLLLKSSSAHQHPSENSFR